MLRYSTATQVDGLPAGGCGAFLPCSFWLADCYLLTGRREEGEALFERLLSLSNDVGLFAEEYDPRTKRMAGKLSAGVDAHGAGQYRPAVIDAGA